MALLGAAPGAAARVERDAWVAALRGDLPPLQLSSPIEVPPPGAVADYFRRYGLDLPGVPHRFGAVEAGGYRIAAHLYRPAGSRGSVLLVHGYLDHSGLLTPLIRRCVADGYAVVAFDLPGHGLSSGDRGNIDEFATYSSVIDDLLRKLGPRLPRPLHAVGHSTGCAALYEQLRGAGGGAFARVVFLAPLVRSAYWHLSRAGHALAGPFLTSVPRVYRENSSDPGYLAEVCSDPLRIEALPLAWMSAHQAWVDRVRNDPTLGRPLLVVQGTADDVVDWEFNLEFLHARFRPATVHLIPDARHQLIHERLELRAVVLDAVSAYLDGRVGP